MPALRLENRLFLGLFLWSVPIGLSACHFLSTSSRTCEVVGTWFLRALGLRHVGLLSTFQSSLMFILYHCPRSLVVLSGRSGDEYLWSVLPEAGVLTWLFISVFGFVFLGREFVLFWLPLISSLA